MKHLFLIFLAFGFISSCDTENGIDCFKTEGRIITEEIVLDDFSKITVFERVELIIQQGDENKVILETGKNLRPNISVAIEDDRLVLRNENSCNLFRDYGVTKVFVTAKNITEIRNSSGLTVSSIGRINYNTLTLIAEDFSNDEFHADGSFKLSLNTENLSIITNTLSYMFLNGTVTNLNINFAAGDSRLEGKDLIAQHVQIFHRSSNDILITPIQSIKGVITAPGDVIAFNTPPIIEVEERYTGRLIFRN